MAHKAPCLNVAGLETVSRCTQCGRDDCYTQAWREHIAGATISVDDTECKQCAAITRAANEAAVDYNPIFTTTSAVNTIAGQHPDYGPGDTIWSPYRE